MQSADRQSADRSSIASIAGPPLRVQASQHVQLPASRAPGLPVAPVRSHARGMA